MLKSVNIQLMNACFDLSSFLFFFDLLARNTSA